MISGTPERRDVDGPPAMALIGAKGNFFQFMRDPIGSMIRLHRNHGEVVAMTKGLPQTGIFLFGPEYNRQVLGNGSIFQCTGYVHSGPQSSANHRISRSLLSMNGEQHREHRKIMTPPFNAGLFPPYQEKIIRLVDQMLDDWDGQSSINLSREMRQLSLAVSGMILFGFDSAAQAYQMGDTIERWMKRNFSIARAVRVTFPGSPYHRMLRAAEKVENIVRQTLQQRKLRMSSEASDLLSTLLQSPNNGSEALNAEQQIGHFTLLFGASYDTIANALTWTQFLLCEHPSVCGKLMEELDGLRGAAPGTGSWEELPFLDQVVKESLRILPPIVFSSRVCGEPVEIGSYNFAEGTTFILSHYITHHMPDLFPQPERFLPERWANTSPSLYSYLPFGASAHICLGASFAIMTMKIAIAMIMQRYRLAIVPNSRIDRNVVLTLNPSRGIAMRVQRQDREFQKSKSVIRGNIHEMVELN